MRRFGSLLAMRVNEFGSKTLTDEQWAKFADKLRYVPAERGTGGAGRGSVQG